MNWPPINFLDPVYLPDISEEDNDAESTSSWFSAAENQELGEEEKAVREHKVMEGSHAKVDSLQARVNVDFSKSRLSLSIFMT